MTQILHQAAREGNDLALKSLLKEGAEIHGVGENGSAILRRAAMRGGADELKALAKRGAMADIANPSG